MDYIGFAMLAAPFVALFIFIVTKDGWKIACCVFATWAAVIAWIAIGIFLSTRHY